MKFNWRANWEILLVLVIIVVGIVITTIAAIRNKDKHLLPLTDDTDYGQLLASGAAGSYSEASATNQQHHNHHSSNQQHQTHPILVDPPLQSTSSPADLPQQQIQAASKTQVRQTTQTPFKPIVKENLNTSNNYRDYHQAHHSQHHEVRQRFTPTKYDDSAEFHRPSPVVSQINSGSFEQHPQATNGPNRFNPLVSADHYEPASTESSLTQVRPEQMASLSGSFSSSPVSGGNGSQTHPLSFTAVNYQSAGSRRHVNRTQLAENELQLNFGDSLSDQADLLDDIHTTRSSLAGDSSSSGSSQQKASNSAGSSPIGVNQQTADLSSTLSLQAPYNAMNANSMNNLGQLLMQTMGGNNNKADQENTILNPEDVLYGRAPQNLNLTEALLNEYSMATLGTSNLNASQQQQLMSSTLLANLLNSLPTLNGDSTNTVNGDQYNQQQQQQQQLPPTPATTPAPTGYRPFSGFTPFSLLLNDLLKIARPHQQQHNEGATNRPALSSGNSILQHSRLSAPLLSLLQGTTANSSPVSHQSADPTQAFHDASESSQHYQRVSMSPTDIQSILAHSLMSTGVLPAFPPPKGSTQNWIPPTSGGNSDFNSAQNSNADFVINNVAGFLRSSQQDASNLPVQNQYDSTTYQRQQSSNNNQQQQQASSFFAPTDIAQAQQMAAHQQQQQQHQQQQQQSDQVKVDQQQQQQQLAATGTNQMPGNAPTLWTQSTVSSGGRQMSPVSNELDRKVSRSTLMGQSNPSQHSQHQTPAGFTNYQTLVHPSNQNGKVSPFNTNMNVINVQQQQQQYHTPSATITSANSVYSPRLPSEIPVPLGYNPPSQAPQQQQQQQQQQLSAASHGEPNLRQTLVASNHKQQQQAQPQIMNKMGTIAPNKSLQSSQPKRRRKRSASGKKSDEKERVDEVMSSRYGSSDDEDDDTDSRPISVVRPDGRPMNSGRVRGFSIAGKGSNLLANSGADGEPAASDRQVAQSQRSANHLGLKRHSDHRKSSSTHRVHHNRGAHQQDGGENDNQKRHSAYLDEGSSANSIQSQHAQRCKHNGHRDIGHKSNVAHLDAASSGLMSKLLGTASTNDELEEELDDDEDPANEKRKEEIDDAEFGIANDDRQRGAPESNTETNNEANQADNGGKMRADTDSGLGSGSTDNESYMRRNQQRSDVEFYGHPGEETRQLKYGILGSGNYEVVNGGIYPEADESTAAVNSVANYVRKPGQSGLLSALPKLLGASEPISPQSAFMPGGRVGGFMRGASEQPNRDEIVGLVPSEESNAKEGLNSPLLELIEANGGQLFDPHLLAQLGSSGSSARSTHTSQDGQTGSRRQPTSHQQQLVKLANDLDESLAERSPDGSKPLSHQHRKSQTKFRNSLQEELGKNYNANMEDSTAERQMRTSKVNSNEIKSAPMDRQQSSISGSRSQGTNQFNSYQLLPSKKVTIFSDQDLDSAPGEEQARWQWPSNAEYPPLV